MLQTAHLDHPFRYALEILTDDGARDANGGFGEPQLAAWPRRAARAPLAARGSAITLPSWAATAPASACSWSGATRRASTPKPNAPSSKSRSPPLTKDAPFDRMFHQRRQRRRFRESRRVVQATHGRPSKRMANPQKATVSKQTLDFERLAGAEPLLSRSTWRRWCLTTCARGSTARRRVIGATATVFSSMRW